MSTRFARWWVAVFAAVVMVFGIFQLQAWPLTSWYMFSTVEPNPTRIARAYAVDADGSERLIGPEVLPAGLLSHRLLAQVADGGRQVCDTILSAAKASGVRILEESWDALVRDGDRPAAGTVVVRARCGTA